MLQYQKLNPLCHTWPVLADELFKDEYFNFIRSQLRKFRCNYKLTTFRYYIVTKKVQIIHFKSLLYIKEKDR